MNQSGVECSVEALAGGEPAIRIGLGYIKGIASEEVDALVAEREHSGAYRGLTDLASRSGMGRDGLERLAWAGACESLGIVGGKAQRREELWRLGIASGSERDRGRGQVQLSLPLSLPAPPDLRPLDSWERIVADYSSTGVTLGEHAMEVLRPELGAGVSRTDELERTPDGARIEIAGLVVARQRPATAKGIVFMLLEDEVGVVNLIVPPPVYERCRLAVRTTPLPCCRQARAPRGRDQRPRLLRRGNERPVSCRCRGAPDRAPAHRELGRLPETELAAVAPRAHSFGHR